MEWFALRQDQRDLRRRHRWRWQTGSDHRRGQRGIAVFTSTGSRNNLAAHDTGITRIDNGRLGNERYVLIADGGEVKVEKVNFSSIPGSQYSPLVVGVIVSAIILIIAAILASIPKKPEMKVSFQNTSRESLEA